jgi:hypothetical protein
MPRPNITVSGEHVDMGPRFFYSAAVAGSPATNAETIICTVTVGADLATSTGALLEGWFSFTDGTSGTAATVKLRQTNVSGSTLAASGAITVVATNVYQFDIRAVDAAPVLPGQVYVMTLQITGGAAVSTVSAAMLSVTAI